jgi:two-component system, NarL family, sensor kinase
MKRTPSSAATQTRKLQLVEEAVLAGSLDRGCTPHPPRQRLNALLHERDRISRYLHDCVLQPLYAIGLSIETAQRQSPDLPPAAKRSSEHAIEQLNNLIQAVRGMMHSLAGGTPPTLDFLSELRALVKTYKEVGQLDITENFPSSVPESLTHEIERELLNVAREALSNCVRHARATRSTVSLDVQGASVRLTVCDDGVGFRLDWNNPKGYGLTNMAGRARELGGSLDVQSGIGEGTQVRVKFVVESALAPR